MPDDSLSPSTPGSFGDSAEDWAAMLQKARVVTRFDEGRRALQVEIARLNAAAEKAALQEMDFLGARQLDHQKFEKQRELDRLDWCECLSVFVRHHLPTIILNTISG